LLLLLRERDTHVGGRHSNGRDELTERAFDALGAVRVHERHPAAAAIDVRHLRCFHGQVYGVAARALHTGGASHVHEQRPTPSAHQLRHRGPVGRHLGDGVAQRASHIAGTVRVHQQRATAIANQLPLLLLLLWLCWLLLLQHLSPTPTLLLLLLPLHRLVWHLPIATLSPRLSPSVSLTP